MSGNGRERNFRLRYHTWWPRCRLLRHTHGSPPPLMYSPALIPEEGSPRPFCLHHTCKRREPAPGRACSLSLTPPLCLSLSRSRSDQSLRAVVHVVLPLSGVREASFNSARTGSAAFMTAQSDDFQLAHGTFSPAILCTPFMSCFLLLPFPFIPTLRLSRFLYATDGL